MVLIFYPTRINRIPVTFEALTEQHWKDYEIILKWLTKMEMRSLSLVLLQVAPECFLIAKLSFFTFRRDIQLSKTAKEDTVNPPNNAWSKNSLTPEHGRRKR